MLRMFARRTSVGNVAAGDEVIVGLSLPSDSVVHDISIRVSLTSDNRLLQGNATMYGAAVYILPVLDPDAGAGFDAIWDALVPKDTDVQTMDLDTGAPDTSPFFEPGEADWSNVFDLGLRPEKLYQRTRLLTMMNGGANFKFQDNQTPFAVLWTPGDAFTIRIRKRFRVRQPSVLLCAIAAPNLDDTTVTNESALLENEWGQIKYARNMLERAMLHVFGLFEAGAETPWEEATALLQKHLDPDMHEDVAATLETVTWDYAVTAMFDHSVVGELGVGAVSLGA